MKKYKESLSVFARRLKELRQENGYTQEQLADKLNTSKSLISYYETAQREPGFTVILELSNIFNESPGYIMGETSTRRVKKIAE